MARELHGPTLGGDLTVEGVELTQTGVRIELGLDEGGESVALTLVSNPARFARPPEKGDRYRVALETTPLADGDDYAVPREPRATVNLGFLSRIEHLLSEANFETGPGGVAADLEMQATEVVQAIAAMRSHLEEAEARDAEA